MDRWAGRVAIVTGASAGIGAAVCQRLADRGMSVVGVARRVDRVKALAATVKAGEIHAVQGDVSKEEDVLRIVAWVRSNLGGADVLVNNAGVLHNSPLLSGKTEDWRHQYEVNVIGLCMLTREVFKDMKERGVNDGHILHVNSVMGHHILPFPGLYVYSATKHSVTVLTEGLRREMRDQGSHVRITSVSPGLVRTEIMEASGFSKPESDEFFGKIRCLEPINVAEAVEYALSAPPSVNVEEITLRVTCASD